MGASKATILYPEIGNYKGSVSGGLNWDEM